MQRPRSVYKTDGGFCEQEQDVAKRWNECGSLFFGIKNQTRPKGYMPMRMIKMRGGRPRRLRREAGSETIRFDELFKLFTIMTGDPHFEETANEVR